MASAGIIINLPNRINPDPILFRNKTFFKIDEETYNISPCHVEIDKNGQIFACRIDDRDPEILEITNLRDVRVGMETRISKYYRDPKYKDIFKLDGKTDDALFEKSITIVYGPNFVDLSYLTFVTQSNSLAKEWSNALFSLMYNQWEINCTPFNSFEKLYTKILMNKNDKSEIPQKTLYKYLTSNKDDQKRLIDIAQSLNLEFFQSRNELKFRAADFSFEWFMIFMKKIGPTAELDRIFTNIKETYGNNSNSKIESDSITLKQLVKLFNESQRDKRLNEILFPFFDDSSIREIIQKWETNLAIAAEDLMSKESFCKMLLSSDYGAIVNMTNLALSDMDQSLCHYFCKSSHNTYLTGHQLNGKSSVEMYKQVLLSGCRCIELDCWDGKDDEPIITHGKTLCTEILFKDVIEAISEYAFKTSDFPVILSFENHCSEKQQAKLASYCKSILGDLLLIKTLDGYPLETDKPLPSPNALKKKILIKNKKKQLKSDIEVVSSNNIDESVVKLELNANGELPQEEMESDAVVEMSLLVNYVEPVHFKGFAVSESRNRRYEMSSFSENSAMFYLKNNPKEFLQYNKKKNSRIYPKGSRVASDNYNPLIYWNLGCQMVALNYQVLDLPMLLNLGFFEYNGRSGYILKHDLMRGMNRTIDVFSESSFEGVITNTLKIKILFGMFLSDKRSGVYVDVDMYGMPSDTIRRRFRTKTTPQSTTSFTYQFEDDTFEFKKIVFPYMALLRISVYEDNNKFIGHRVIRVETIENGYRYVKLRNESNQPLSLATLFVHISTTDYVPSTFSDIADALSDPTAFMSQIEKRNHQLKTLEEEYDTSNNGENIDSSNTQNSFNSNTAYSNVESSNITSDKKSQNANSSFVKSSNSKEEVNKDSFYLDSNFFKNTSELKKTGNTFESMKSYVNSVDLSIGKIKNVVDLAKDKNMLLYAANLYKSYENVVKNQLKSKDVNQNLVLIRIKKGMTDSLNRIDAKSTEGINFKEMSKKLFLDQLSFVNNSVECYYKEMVQFYNKEKIAFFNQCHKNYLKITVSLKQKQDTLNKEEIKRIKKAVQSRDDLIRLTREHADKCISNAVKDRQKLEDKYEQQKMLYEKDFEFLLEQINAMKTLLNKFTKKTFEESLHSIDQLTLVDFCIFKAGWIPFEIATHSSELENCNTTAENEGIKHPSK